MTKTAKYLSLTACALAASLLLSGCGGGADTQSAAPTVAVSAAASGSDVLFTFVFSEDVGTTFTADDVSVSGGAKAATLNKVDATHYTLVVTPDNGSANVTATVEVGKFSAAARTANVVSGTATYAAGCGTTAPACAPTTVVPTGAVTIYSDAVTATGFKPRPDWGQTVAQSEETIARNKSLKYVFSGGGFGAAGAYEGIEWGAVDVSAKGKLHMDVWSADMSSLKISLVGGGETAVTQAMTATGWNSIDIDLSKFTNVNKAAVIQLKLESATAGTVYVDNIYFWDSACGTTTPTCAPTTTIPTGSVTIYSDAVTATGFKPRPDWGQTVAQSEETIASNKSLKYVFSGGGFGAAGAYEGIEWGAVDVSAKGKLHMDVWSADMSSLKISLVGGGETAVTQAMTATGWNSIDIDLSKFTNVNKAAVIQLKLESATAGTVYVDNIHFWGTPSSNGGGSSNTFTGGIYASDYTGSLAANTQASTLGGTVGFFYDQRLFDTKIYDAGSVTGSAADPGGVHNFWYGFGKATTPVYTNAYFGGFVNAPGNGSADASPFSNIKLKFWGDAESWEKSNFTPTAEVVVQGPKNSACTNPSGRPELSKTVSGQKIGAGSEYTIAKADFTITQSCNGAYTKNTVWSAVNVVVVQLTGTSLQYTNIGGGGAYPTFLNIGPISFTN